MSTNLINDKITDKTNLEFKDDEISDTTFQDNWPIYIPPTIHTLIPELMNSLTDATEVALAVLGNVDAGKSTLTSGLCNRILDNGDGSARDRVAIHQHEKDSGKTSTVSAKTIEYSEHHIKAFTEGKIHHELDLKKKSKNAKNANIPNTPMKIVGLHDLCGHEKYFGTTSHGVSSMYPDFAILAINPGRGVLDMTKEHYTIAVSLNIPIVIVVTKVDCSMKNSCSETNKQITNLLKKYRRQPHFINSYDDYHFYKAGETVFLNLRNKFYKGSNEYGFADRAEKSHIKIQSMRDDEDEFMVEIKSHFPIDGNSKLIIIFKKQYSLSDDEYDQLKFYINYNIRKMSSINTIVSNLNMTSMDNNLKDNCTDSDKQSIIPVIYISNYNGYNLDTLRDSIMFLKPRDIWNKENNSIVKMLGKKLNKPNLGKVDLTGSTFYIDRAYTVEGAGLVVSGINRGKSIKIGDRLFIGPVNKNFIEIKIKSIHNDARQFVDSLDEHHRGCLNVVSVGKEKIIKSGIKKGMVMISDRAMMKHVGFHFRAVITVLRNETKSATLRVGACPLMDGGTIKQTVRLITIYNDTNTIDNNEQKIPDVTYDHMSFKSRSERKRSEEIVKPGEVREVMLKFTRHPEFIPEGEQFIFRSGTVHGIGVVIQPIDVSTDPNAFPDPSKSKHSRIRVSNRNHTLNLKKNVSTVQVIKVE
jgi:GTPase